MKEDEEYDEIDRELDILINQEMAKLITDQIGQFTCQLFKVNSEEQAVPFASGVLVEFSGSHFILTASHVIEDWSDKNKLFIPFKGTYISIVGTARGAELDNKKHKIDVACIKLKDELVFLLRTEYIFLGIDKIRGYPKLSNEETFCVFGYPAINKKIIDGKLKTTGAAYFSSPCQDKVLEYYGFDTKTHFAVRFEGKAINIKTNTPDIIKTEHYGLSGCGLWHISIDHDGEKFTSEANLIGIMSEFRRGKYDCLIGNRIELILITLQEYFELKFKTKI